MSQPKVRIPIVATNGIYLDPGQPWDGTVTKIDPSNQNIGYVPGNRLPAQYINFNENAWTRWLDYLKDLPVRNWYQYSIGSIWDTHSLEGVGYMPATKRWIFGQRSKRVR